ncbi:MAG: hypothetical protein JNJ73_19545 [Hyphomonadaceae bacterium]|nr:hypothetical protein [Hyphomonadaceae bacterium]
MEEIEEKTLIFVANMKELARLGGKADRLNAELERWKEDNRKGAFGVIPPSRASLFDWQKLPGETTSITTSKLALLCALMMYGRSSVPGEAEMAHGRRAAEAMFTTATEQFFVDFPMAGRAEAMEITASVDNPYALRLMATAKEAALLAQSKGQELHRMWDEDPIGLESMLAPHIVDNKTATLFDMLVESECRNHFRRAFDEKLQVIGEESLARSPKWDAECEYGVLMDAVDGTDVLSMGLGLWCSAIAVVDLVNASILGTVVAIPSGTIYYASQKEEWAWRDEGISLSGCSEVRALHDARIAFYGQKAKNLRSVGRDERFLRFLETIGESDQQRFRAFNFGGNNMLVQLSDRKKVHGKPIAEGVDAVFELFGQRPHDFVPGAYIALKSGAFMCGLDGDPISIERLGQWLLMPNERQTYVIASTEELARDLLANIETRPSEGSPSR